MRAHRVLARAAAAAPAALLTRVLPLAAQPPASPTAAVVASTSAVATTPAGETVLGLTAAASGTGRDTLGLLVVAVTRDGPADRAGITEGSRLAEVNGVSLRLTPAEVGTGGAGAAVQRFDRALWAVRPGDGVVLRLAGFGNGRTVTVPTAGPPAAAAAAAFPAPGAAAAAPPPEPRAPVDRAPVERPAVERPAVADAAAPRLDTLAVVIAAMGDLQTQLHRLARDESALALADTLAAVERDLETLRRRLRSAHGQVSGPPAAPPFVVRPPAAAPASAPRADSGGGGARLRVREDVSDGRPDAAPAAPAALPGLRVAPVTPDLARYFGEGSERGLLVVQADSTWDPIRAGDVLVRVDGAPAEVARLRAAFSGRQQSTVEFLRRGRVLTLTLQAGAPR